MLNLKTLRIISAIKHSGGLNNVVVIADFDGTLTHGIDTTGKILVNSINCFRLVPNILDSNYQNQANEIAAKYHPIEKNPTIPEPEKITAMQQWWTEHYKLLQEKKATKAIIEKIVTGKYMHIRPSIHNFFSFLSEHSTQILIYSAGTGNIIEEYLKQELSQFNNIQLLSNHWKFNLKNEFIGVDNILHSMNKNGLAIKERKLDKLFSKTKNIILIGDSEGDSNMNSHLEYKNCLKIGILNKLKTDPTYDESLRIYLSLYDIVLPYNTDLEEIIDILKLIC